MYAEIVILATLRSKPQHGYEIKKRVERILGGAIPINNKVLYPTLRRFEEMGAVERTVERQDGKPDRHIYHLTERGVETLQALLRDFPPSLADSDAEFFVRVAFFGLLEPEARLDILHTREQAIEKHLAHIRVMKVLADDADAGSYPWRVLLFHEKQNRSKLEWVQVLIQEQQELLQEQRAKER